MERFMGWMIESSILILMILGIRRLFAGKVRYAALHMLWLAVFLRFLIPVNLISTPYSVGNLLSGALSYFQEREEGNFLTGRDEKKMPSMEAADSKVAVTSIKKQTTKDNRLVLPQKEIPVTKTEKKAGTKDAFLSGGTQIPMLRWLITAILFLWFLLSNAFLMVRLRKSRVFFCKKGKLSVYRTAHLKSPCLYGVFRPVIYIPATLKTDETVTEEEMEQILTHEYVHYRHLDHVFSVLRMILTAVYWFDPFLLYAVSCSKKDTELFCDETVIRLLGEKKRFEYGKMLIRLAGDHHISDFRYAMLTMSRRGREMEKRIRALGRKRQYSKRVWIPLLSMAAIVFSITCSAGTISVADFNRQISHWKKEAKENKTTGTQKENFDTGTENGIENARKIYAAFLKKHASEPGFEQYALIQTDEKSAILFVTDSLTELTEKQQGASVCRLYSIKGNKVVFASDVVCDPHEWIRYSDGTVWSANETEISKIAPDAGNGKISLQSVQKKSESAKEENKEYFLWLEEYTKAPGVVFYGNPYAAKKKTSGEEFISLQNEDDLLDLYKAGKLSTLYVNELAQTFDRYIEYFTEAVNTGNTDKLDLILENGSEAYKEQCKWAKNYHKRGIREKVKSYQIVSTEILSIGDEVIHSNEAIKVSYANGSRKTLHQRYQYSCKYTENGWRITDITEENEEEI